MKRFFAVLVLALATLSVSAKIDVKKGVIAGLTSNSNDLLQFDISQVNHYHFGVAMRLEFPMGISVQPMLLYSMKGAVIDTDAAQGGISVGEFTRQLNTKTGYAEFGTQIQWGSRSDFLAPYVFAEPFAGYAITNEFETITRDNLAGAIIAGNTEVITNQWDYMNKLEYGLGFGVGVEVFDFLQVQAKYYWNFGSLYNGKELEFEDSIDVVTSSYVSAFESGKQFSGLLLSAAIFF